MLDFKIMSVYNNGSITKKYVNLYQYVMYTNYVREYLFSLTNIVLSTKREKCNEYATC